MLDRLSAQLGDTFAGKRFDRLTAFSFRDLAVARHRVTTRQNWPRLSYEADSRKCKLCKKTVLQTSRSDTQIRRCIHAIAHECRFLLSDLISIANKERLR